MEPEGLRAILRSVAPPSAPSSVRGSSCAELNSVGSSEVFRFAGYPRFSEALAILPKLAAVPGNILKYLILRFISDRARPQWIVHVRAVANAVVVMAKINAGSEGSFAKPVGATGVGREGGLGAGLEIRRDGGTRGHRRLPSGPRSGAVRLGRTGAGRLVPRGPRGLDASQPGDEHRRMRRRVHSPLPRRRGDVARDLP